MYTQLCKLMKIANVDQQKKFIIGNGFLGKKFKKYLNFLKKNQIIIYVAGISNSSERNQVKLNREIK